MILNHLFYADDIVVFSPSVSGLQQLYRGLCARGNTILRNFATCSLDAKKMLFNSFCVSFYCMSLVFNVKQRTMNKLKVCYNDCFRRLLCVPRRSSASALFVNNGLPSFQEVRRKNIVGYIQRIKRSENLILKNIAHPAYLFNSIIFRHWGRLIFV